MTNSAKSRFLIAIGVGFLLPMLGIASYISQRTGIAGAYIITFTCAPLLLLYRIHSVSWHVLLVCLANVSAASIAALFGDESLMYRVGISVWFSISMLACLLISDSKSIDMVVASLIFGAIAYAAVLLVPIVRFGTFSVGGHYHGVLGLDSSAFPFQVSALDPALLVGSLAVAAGAAGRHALGRRNWHLAMLLGVVCCLACVELAFLNRRAVLGAVAGALAAIVVGRWAAVGTLGAILLPLCWGMIANTLVEFTKYDFVRELLVRAEETDLSDGNARNYLWEKAIESLESPSISASYLFGDRSLVEAVMAGDKRQVLTGHAHHAGLQSFVERGFVGLAAWVAFCLLVIYRLVNSPKWFSSWSGDVAWGWCVYLLVLSGMESLSLAPGLGLLFLSCSAGALFRWTNRSEPETVLASEVQAGGRLAHG